MQEGGGLFDLIISSLSRIGKFLLKAGELAFAYHDAHEKVVASGWIPSMVIPYARLVEELTQSPNLDVDGFLRRYFSEEFSEAMLKLIERVKSHAPDQHCKTILEQAMTAHAQGLYHCVSPTIFAELERVIRIRVGAKSHLRVSKIKEIMSGLKAQPLAVFVQAGPLVLTDILTEYVYRDTRGEKDFPFLNRHTVMHGFKPGNGFKDSMNALLLADSVLGALSSKYPASSTDAQTGGGAVLASLPLGSANSIIEGKATTLQG